LAPAQIIEPNGGSARHPGAERLRSLGSLAGPGWRCRRGSGTR